MTRPSTDRELWESWGKRLRTLREQRKWTQAQLAEASGQLQGTISAIERGMRGGGELTRIAIADALGIPAADLFSYEIHSEMAS